jgi:Ca2+-binding EF-hand superfamily protein
MLLSEADEDGNGVVDYEEFIPLCFKILVEKFKEDYLRTKALQEAGELEAIMLDEFVAQGLDPSGKMSRKKVKKVMENINADFFGLSRVQIVTVLGLAEADGQGEVDVARFLRSAQNMLFKLMESTKQVRPGSSQAW